jgi:hypothetical protein
VDAVKAGLDAPAKGSLADNAELPGCDDSLSRRQHRHASTPTRRRWCKQETGSMPGVAGDVDLRHDGRRLNDAGLWWPARFVPIRTT